MNEFIVVKFNFWVLQWLRLLAAVVGILTLSKIDISLTFERWYLDKVGNYFFGEKHEQSEQAD